MVFFADGINPRFLAILSSPSVPIMFMFSSFAYFRALASSISRVAFSSLARTIASASPLSISFSRRVVKSVFLIFLVSIHSILLKIVFSCSFAVISLCTASGIMIFWKSSFRIDSLLVLSRTMRGLASEMITYSP